MAEYIERDVAKKALLQRCDETGYGGLTKNDVNLVFSTPWRIPPAQVVEAKEAEAYAKNQEDALKDLVAELEQKEKQYDELLKAAKAMHTWIFLHTMDEEEAYKECGLSDEMNRLLGSLGGFEIHVKGVKDATD